MITGLFSVAAQVLIPFATMTVKPEKMGEVVGLLMSGLLVGILLSTSLAGLLSNLFHWKVIYLISGVLMLCIAAVLKARLPFISTSKLSYLAVFQSMGKLILEERRLVYRALLGAFAFAAMSVLFSTIAVLLKSSFGLADFMVGIVANGGSIRCSFDQTRGKNCRSAMLLQH